MRAYGQLMGQRCLLMGAALRPVINVARSPSRLSIAQSGASTRPMLKTPRLLCLRSKLRYHCSVAQIVVCHGKARFAWRAVAVHGTCLIGAIKQNARMDTVDNNKPTLRTAGLAIQAVRKACCFQTASISTWE
jgi:hypothetical protein